MLLCQHLFKLFPFLQNVNIVRKITNVSFESLVNFTYIRMTVTNRNYFHEEIKTNI
jgi:hypothetical protein